MDRALRWFSQYVILQYLAGYRGAGASRGAPLHPSGERMRGQIVLLATLVGLLSTPAELTETTAKYHVPELRLFST